MKKAIKYIEKCSIGSILLFQFDTVSKILILYIEYRFIVTAMSGRQIFYFIKKKRIAVSFMHYITYNSGIIKIAF